MDKPIRKHNRLSQYNYSQNGAYFITVCTKNRMQMLSRITLLQSAGHPGTGVPTVELLWRGIIADQQIRKMDAFYDGLSVDRYVIMPDHIHLLISIHDGQENPEYRSSAIARFIGTFKRFCNKEYGENIWQTRYFDHVIRNQQDYEETWEYIENNPHKWALSNNMIRE